MKKAWLTKWDQTPLVPCWMERLCGHIENVTRKGHASSG